MNTGQGWARRRGGVFCAPGYSDSTLRSRPPIHALNHPPTREQDQVVKEGKHGGAGLVDGHHHGVVVQGEVLEGLHHLRATHNKGCWPGGRGGGPGLRAGAALGRREEAGALS